MTGPFVFFSDYKAFVFGTNIPADKASFILHSSISNCIFQVINPLRVAIDKLAFAFTCLFLATVLGGTFSLEIFNDSEVNDLPLWRWLAMLCFAMFVNRLSFYYIWIMGKVFYYLY